MKYPIGIQNFESLIRDGYVYVDKTSFFHQLVGTGRYYFLSRPRRFGKSLLISTLEAYFQGKKELFKGLAIEQIETEWKQYPILHLDLNSQKYDTPESLNSILNLNLSKWEDKYGRYKEEDTLSLRFAGVIERAAQKEGLPVVILVDEYDKPLLQAIGNKPLQEQFRATLKSFYSVLKTQDQYIKFGFLTGVTKFSKVSVFSDLNNLTDISTDARYQSICGITEEEIHQYFEDAVKQLAQQNGTTLDLMLEKLRERYDGYHFVEHGMGIYNPFSLLNTLNSGKLGNYWFETGTPTFLVTLLQQDNFRLPDLTTEEFESDRLNSVTSGDDDPIPVIYQSGYLTIKDYDPEFDSYILGFPNKEVEQGFTKFLLPIYTHASYSTPSSFSLGAFVRDLRQGRPDDFMKRMAALMADTDYRVVGNSELYFQNAFYLIAKLLGFYVQVERATSNGRIDMTIQTNDYIYILEFKLDKTADAALQQINDKEYALPFATDQRKLYKIGINFSLKKRCIDGWKVQPSENC